MKRMLIWLVFATSACAGLNWNGTTDYIAVVGSDCDSPVTITLAMWVRWTSLSTANATLFNVANGNSAYRLRMNGPGHEDHCELRIADSTADEYVFASWRNDAFSTNTWYFLAFTWAGNAAVPKMYYRAAGGAWTAATPTYTEGNGDVDAIDFSSTTLYCGNVDTDEVTYHHGDMSFLALWYTELTEGQLKSVATRPTAACLYSNLKVLCFPGLHGASTIPNLCSANPSITPTNLTVTASAPVGPLFGK